MRPLLIVALALLLPLASARAQERLGRITFPTSGAGEAQPDFIRGVLLLHSFEYARARDAFRQARRRDPAFVMAYWGEALAWNHSLWQEQQRDSARAVLGLLGATRAARLARASSPREAAWLESVEILYGDGSKATRDTLYCRALEAMLHRWPDDDEVRTLHALALLALSPRRDTTVAMQAGRQAMEVLRRNPEHPGAAHYAIHAFDNPVHAPLGLPAARAYAAIAPSAAHAQHMTTHIFLTLGEWPATVTQNALAAGPDTARWQAGHYTYWLHYGLLQQGREDEAAALLTRLYRHLEAGAAAPRRAHLARMRAQQVINLEHWYHPSLEWRIELGDTGSISPAMDAFARGYAALRRGEVSGAEAAARRLEAADDGVTSALLARILRAALLRQAGRRSQGMEALRAVAESSARISFEAGPPDLVKPPFELLGEWMLEDGDQDGARQAFERALELMPGRRMSLSGLARLTGPAAVR